ESWGGGCVRRRAPLPDRWPPLRSFPGRPAPAGRVPGPRGRARPHADRPGDANADSGGSGTSARGFPCPVPPADSGRAVVSGDSPSPRSHGGDRSLAGLQGPQDASESAGQSPRPGSVMKCRAVRAWMLTDETPQRAPSPVRRPLQRCSRCRTRYGRLVRLIHEVRELPLPSGDCPARTELLQRLAALPAPAPSVEASPPVLRPTRSAGGRARWAVAAAVLLLTFGTGLILFTRQGGNPQQPSPPDSPSTATVPAERPLEDRLLEQHLRLAEAEGPAEQLEALTHMATDLRTESLRAARRGAEKDVAYLTWLHGRVVDEGIVRCAAELPGGGKASLSPVLAQLRRTADEAREARRESPKVAASMDVVEATAREAIRALEGDPAVRPLRQQPQPPVELAASNLLRVLVAESLLVVGEDDPVRRAGHSSRVADSLAKTIVEKGDTTDPQEAARLGEKLGAVVN